MIIHIEHDENSKQRAIYYRTSGILSFEISAEPILNFHFYNW